MIVRIGTDNIVKNTYDGDNLDNFAEDEIYPEDTFVVVDDLNFVEIGDEWHADAQQTMPENPFPSWNFNTETWQWEPPVPRPDTEIDVVNQWWNWIEEDTEWVLVTETPPE